MSLLLVLFPQDKSNSKLTSPSSLPLSSPSSSSSSKSLIISKAQSTISICALLLFTTLLLFTLSTLPTTPPPPSRRRFLLHKNHNPTHNHHFALQKMGTLYLRGTKPMSDLLICHVADETTHDDFRFFLRLLHRSTITSSTDVVFIFSSPSFSSSFSHIIQQENKSFATLIHSNSSNSNTFFNTSRFFRNNNHPIGEPLWGNKIRTQNKTNSNNTTNSLSYGSVLSFDATELDPENSLAGFLDRVPFSLRRWACYPMLLGRVRHNFKHVMLVDVKSVLILRDSFGRVKNRSPESVLFFNKHGKKISSNQKVILPAVVIGGARGVRRLSNAVMVEIVRAATQHRKKRNSVSESSVLSQLASNEFLMRSKNVQLIVSNELIPEMSSLSGHNYAIIQRGMNNHDFNSVIKKQICSSVVDSSVYKDC
ncbi:hypothetical protein TSUD_332320 [Trifolium subterraneum]|uniref:DUF7780 domain-containing protein n=1 Tax=Trifolium subterraneum TaxID=3900 RepID=A0A2Z6MJR6_TRISU|nr:hypothetical protein TSUD_332320 [Trifolium subterraneum]